MTTLTHEELSLFSRPAWNSLNTKHRDLSLGTQFARRFQPSVNQFLATESDTEEQFEAASQLVAIEEEIFTVQKGPPPQFIGFEMTKSALCVQMICDKPIPTPEHNRSISILGATDAAEMLELAILTQPGPFSTATYKMGDFIGIYIDNRLAAMSGQRFAFDRFVELSGVCTHPDFQGQGLGKLMSALMTKQIQESGKTPFLHAWKTNENAIKLYEKLGYRTFNEVTASVYVKHRKSTQK